MRQEIEYVAESAVSVMICVELVDGCLQRPVRIPYSTFDGTTQSMFTAILRTKNIPI